MLPGTLRATEVRVGQHVAPAAAALPAFLRQLEAGYRPADEPDRLARVARIAAAHHRLAWVHPFLDGNGRVGRLFSDAAFRAEGLDAGGLWSMSRGLARQQAAYQRALAVADARRYDNDGRGNLSERALVAFCRFFLEVALDQVTYMSGVLAVDGVLARLRGLVQPAGRQTQVAARSLLRARSGVLEGQHPAAGSRAAHGPIRTHLKDAGQYPARGRLVGDHPGGSPDALPGSVSGGVCAGPVSRPLPRRQGNRHA